MARFLSATIETETSYPMEIARSDAAVDEHSRPV